MVLGNKIQAVQVRSTTESDDAGIVEAIVAVFGNVDSYGDVILKGAFADSLKQWEERGEQIPFVWSHQKDDPFSHIGTVLEAKETDTGLWVKAQLDLENPTAAQVHRLLKGRRVKEFSFAFSYDPEDVKVGEKDGGVVRELHRLSVHEVGPTLIGANPATQLLDVKSAGEGEPPAEDDSGDDDDATEGDVKTLLAEIVASLANISSQLAKMSVSGTDDAGAGDASSGQADSDEASGKSGDRPADESASIKTNLASLKALLEEEA